jgi:hypothetical protein
VMRVDRGDDVEHVMRCSKCDVDRALKCLFGAPGEVVRDDNLNVYRLGHTRLRCSGRANYTVHLLGRNLVDEQADKCTRA